MEWYHLIGYTGSVLIAVALMMRNIWKLRWINMFGAATFAVYGVLIHSYPVVVLNSWNTCVNIFYLWQSSKKKDYFSLLPLPEMKTNYLEKFITFYSDDIAEFFPDFDWDTLEHPHGYFVLRNLVPVGLFVYCAMPNGVADIKIDYVIPDYRDFKNAHFTYSEQLKTLQDAGMKFLLTKSDVLAHQQYLKKIGFVQDATDTILFKKTI